MRVAVTGGTGVVGRPLVSALVRAGHEVTVLSRAGQGMRTADGYRAAAWDPESGEGLEEAMRGATAVVHLARSPLPMRWTPDARRALRKSRVGMVRRIVDAIGAAGPPVKTFLCGSSHDIYGNRASDAPLSETEPPGSDFLATLYADIEEEACRARSLGVRVVLARIGVVLGPGAPNPKWIPHVVADTQGALSWVHVEDAGAMLRRLVEGDVDGPVNVTAERATTASAVARHLQQKEGRDPADVLARRAALRQSGSPPAARAAARPPPVGDVEGDHVSYQTHWAYPAVMERLGYRWSVSTLEAALRD